jgi:hypothetical protein
MEDHLDRTRGNDHSSQHSQRNKREYGRNDHHSSQPPSNGGESPSRNGRYNRDEDRESYRSGKTPYNNGGKEDAFNTKGAEDEESDGPASQRQGDYNNHAFEPEGRHDTRAVRAQAHQSPDQQQTTASPTPMGTATYDHNSNDYPSNRRYCILGISRHALTGGAMSDRQE